MGNNLCSSAADELPSGSAVAASFYDLQAPLLDGGVISFDQLRGKVVLAFVSASK